MVATLLTADGFRAHDLGIHVTAGQLLQAARGHDAEILAMSAMMTTALSEQRNVIGQLQVAGIRGTIKVMVGGGGVTQESADQIGADGYDPTAPGAVKLARELLGL